MILFAIIVIISILTVLCIFSLCSHFNSDKVSAMVLFVIAVVIFIAAMIAAVISFKSPK